MCCEYLLLILFLSEDGNITLADLPEIGSDEHREIWQLRIREVCSISLFLGVSCCLTLSLLCLCTQEHLFVSFFLCLFALSALKSMSVSLGLTLYSRAFFSNKRVCVDPSASLLTVCHQSRKIVSLENVSSPLNLNINSLYVGYFFFFFFLFYIYIFFFFFFFFFLSSVVFFFLN